MKNRIIWATLMVFVILFLGNLSIKAQSSQQLNLSQEEATSILQKAPGGEDLIFAGGNDRWANLDLGPITHSSNTSQVLAIAVADKYIYVGGQFEKINDVTMNHIARFNLESREWEQMKVNDQIGVDASGYSSFVQTIKTDGDDVYIGGRFSTAGGVTVNHITRWNTDTFYPLQAGDDSQPGVGPGGNFVLTIDILMLDNNKTISFNDNPISAKTLIVGGRFYQAGGEYISHLAHFDPHNNGWEQVGNLSLNGDASEVLIDGTTIYVGGWFTEVNSTPVDYIFSSTYPFDSFTSFGVGPNKRVTSIAKKGSDLYVGGDFGSVGELSTGSVAKYDLNAKSWSSIGIGTSVLIRDLLFDGDILYISGGFIYEGNDGNEYHRVHAFNTAQNYWIRMGDGVRSEVYANVFALAKMDQSFLNIEDETNAIIVGGHFTFAGDKSVNNIAFWDANSYIPSAIELQEPALQANGLTRQPTFTWTSDDVANTYEMHIATISNFSTVFQTIKGITFNEYTLEENTALEFQSGYYWRVRGIGDDGVGPWSETWSFTTVRDLPAQVNLLYPNNDDADIALRPEFKWSQAERADSYELQVSSNQDYSDPVISRNTRANLTYTPEADLDGVTRYWFRVRGINEQGPGPWSTPRSFVTKLDVPGKVFLRFPNNNSTGVSLTPEFTWSEVDGAESYHLQVSRNDGFGTTVIDKEGVKTTKVGFEQGNLQALTAYYFRVRAKNAKGYGEWSDVRGFVTKEAELAGNVTDIRVRQITTKQVVSKTHSVQSTAAFEISWTQPAFDGGTPIVDYRIVFRTADETNWTTYERPASTDTVAIVTGFESGVAYAFDVLAVNAVGAPEPTDDPPVVVSIETEEVPTEVTLVQNYPNPFNPATTIRFSLPVSSEVRLEVYSMLGQRLAVLVQGQQPAGWHTVSLNATSWASGTYVYRLQADGFTQTKKFLLVK